MRVHRGRWGWPGSRARAVRGGAGTGRLYCFSSAPDGPDGLMVGGGFAAAVLDASRHRQSVVDC